jgi:hypothetical protein
MSLIDSELQDGLSEMEADQSTDGVTQLVTYAVKDWPCSTGTKKRGQTVEIGGKVIVFDFSIRIRKNAVASGGVEFQTVAVPRPGNNVVHDETTYTIEFVDTAFDAFYALYLISNNA